MSSFGEYARELRDAREARISNIEKRIDRLETIAWASLGQGFLIAVGIITLLTIHH